MAVRLFLTAAFTVSAGLTPSNVSAEQILYNGIELPTEWPPANRLLTREPTPVPYLDHPPEVIPIDLGRQLFVDDFLIERTTLTRTFHHAKYHPSSPVVTPDRPWEQRGRSPTAMVFSDGVWYDPADGFFKMWYMGGYCAATCLALSKDGVHWTKPSLDVVEPGTNIIHGSTRDSATVWLDHFDKDPNQRWKMLLATPETGPNHWRLNLHYSADGIHWGQPVKQFVPPQPTGDRTTFFYNPYRRVWVLSIRRCDQNDDLGRSRFYWESADLADGLQWEYCSLYRWTNADRLDPRNPNINLRDVPPELYCLDVVPYESLLVGLFSVWQGDPGPGGPHKRNEILLGFSRDGFHWHRPDRTPFLGVNENEKSWNGANVQSAGGGCLVVNDYLYFYVSGRKRNRQASCNSTGLALLRRDGFASLDAGKQEAALLTRPIRLGKKHLFVNINAPDGELLAEILDTEGAIIQTFSRDRCLAVRGDETCAELRWSGAADLAVLAGRPVRLRLFLRNGSIYSFWTSSTRSGASDGYVAAGGPGLVGPTDTVGTLLAPRPSVADPKDADSTDRCANIASQVSNARLARGLREVRSGEPRVIQSVWRTGDALPF